jgi:hypothetical protein
MHTASLSFVTMAALKLSPELNASGVYLFTAFSKKQMDFESANSDNCKYKVPHDYLLKKRVTIDKNLTCRVWDTKTNLSFRLPSAQKKSRFPNRHLGC